jgi:hypothetical protein
VKASTSGFVPARRVSHHAGEAEVRLDSQNDPESLLRCSRRADPQLLFHLRTEKGEKRKGKTVENLTFNVFTDNREQYIQFVFIKVFFFYDNGSSIP